MPVFDTRKTLRPKTKPKNSTFGGDIQDLREEIPEIEDAVDLLARALDSTMVEVKPCGCWG